MGLMLRRMCMMGASAIPTPPLIKTVTGALLHITDALAKPAKKLVVNLEPVQSGSGDPSPENVRPITGWTGANVQVSGENLFDPDSPNHWYVNASKTKVLNSNARAIVIPCQQGDRFNVSVERISSTAIAVSFADASGNVLSRAGSTSVDKINETAPANSVFVYITVEDITNISKICANKGSTYSEYSAYSGTTIPITFPDAAGTVYGGTLTINEDGSGELVNEWYSCVFGVSIDYIPNGVWDYNNDAKNTIGAYWNTGSILPVGKTYSSWDGGVGNRLANNRTYYKYGVSNQDDPNLFSMSGMSGQYVAFRIPKNELADISSTSAARQSILDYFIANPVQVAYTLATPITYQLTSQQVLTLLKGENNIWSDANGELELTYYAKAEETP